MLMVINTANGKRDGMTDYSPTHIPSGIVVVYDNTAKVQGRSDPPLIVTSSYHGCQSVMPIRVMEVSIPRPFDKHYFVIGEKTMAFALERISIALYCRGELLHQPTNVHHICLDIRITGDMSRFISHLLEATRCSHHYEYSQRYHNYLTPEEIATCTTVLDYLGVTWEITKDKSATQL